jgi:uncharacterized protein YjeT (DUF2065 family)
MGMVMVIEGLPYFAYPEKMKEMMMVVTTLPHNVLRRFGGILMFLGLGFVYLGKCVL